jgi:hypothetical protein
MSEVKITRIDNFVCPACGELIKQVAARDGIVKGWCRQAKCEIKVDINAAPAELPATVVSKAEEPVSYLAGLKHKREKVLQEVVSAREDGDLKEKILKEEDKIRRANSGK